MTDQDPAIALFDRWTAMWNGNLDLAPEIMATHFVLRYGQPGTEPMDAVHTPEQLQQLIARWRKMRRDPVFRAEGRPIKEIDGSSGLVVRPYSSTFELETGVRKTVSGIDILIFANRKIVEVLSASGGPEGRSFNLTQ